MTFALSQRKRKISLARNGERGYSRLRETYEAEHRADKEHDLLGGRQLTPQSCGSDRSPVRK